MMTQNIRHHIVISNILMISCLIGFLSSSTAMAQKYACVNTEQIFQRLNDYKQVQQRLDRYVEEWQKEIEDKYQEYETMQTNYQQQVYLLPDNLKKHHEEQIAAKYQEIMTLQQQRFGVDGDLDRKRAELLKPVQDRVYSAIERVASEKNYAFVFDRSAGSAVLYASAKYDITAQVLEILGYSSGSGNNDATRSAPDKEKIRNIEKSPNDRRDFKPNRK